MKCFLLAIMLFLCGHVMAIDSIRITSPDNKTSVVIHINKKITYTLSYNGVVVLQPSEIDMIFNGVKISDDLRIASSKNGFVKDSIISPVPEKRKVIPDVYNQLNIQFKKPYSLIFRVYNDGVAYQFVTKFRDSITVKNELAEFMFSPGQKVLLPLTHPREDVDRFHTSFEELYQLKNMDSISKTDLAYTPVLVGDTNNIKIGISESDLEDYPGMFISGNNNNALHGVFAGYPLKEVMTKADFPQLVVTQRADYIAKTNGRRSFPWRIIMIAPGDEDLPGNDIVYRLASPPKQKDVSYIKPGKGTDEWIIGINLFNVPFKAGINTATYKYYIDFAKQFGFDRIMMDAGWSDYKDLFKITPAINMDTLAAYAKHQGVKLSMWTLCSTLDRQLDSALVQFNKWGVDFIMTDFMDRDDQKMVNFYHRIAKACADHKIMIMFHGAFPPKGFNRTYPNAVTREGVIGSEYNIWSDKPTPDHDLILPFTRMLSGPMDYEPGILDNATKAQFRSIDKKVMSQGTRCHQLAMFVVYDSPIQIFSGNPSQGMMEPAFMKLLGSIPTTWDDSKILNAKVGDYIITARRKGDDWYIGGMTDWTSRNFDFPLDFISEGNYKAEFCSDGINADNYPSDYVITNYKAIKNNVVNIKMAQGGGFVLKLTKQD